MFWARGVVREVSGTVEIEPSLRRAGVDMELCLAQRMTGIDLIETLGQRQCSAPGFRDKSSRERQRVRIY